MQSCILTIIKNEHEYLDEWIKYHLNLGIDHIFIFEDIDSESHKNITSKYKDVSLDVISNILTDDDKNKAIELKQTKSSNPQYIYIKKGLTFLSDLHIYDWCFVIDNDEFITFETNGSKLEDILEIYRDYDAIILQWKIYGASGHIKKPSYKNGGIIDTYTEEMKGYIPIKKPYLTKPCYNMTTYKSQFFGHIHQTSDFCNWCKTDFSKNRETIVYKNIYLRHYITKSWEEYVWKRKTRGYFCGLTRNMDFFFKINSDLKDKKEELINALKQETLVVLPFKQNGSQGNEIRLTLNLWNKFCIFPYHFIVIGEFNDNLKNEFSWVEFIYCQSKEKIKDQYNQHLDVQHCMEVITNKYHEIYNGFIWIADDNYAIKPFDLKDITTIHYHSIDFQGQENRPTSYWNHDKWKTRQLLDKENLPHINYTTHYPCYFEFKKLKEIWNKFNMANESYVLEDIYFNYFKYEDPILDNEIRLGIWNYNIYKNEFKKAIENPNIKFICNSVEGWSKELEDSLWQLYKKEES